MYLNKFINGIEQKLTKKLQKKNKLKTVNCKANKNYFI